MAMNFMDDDQLDMMCGGLFDNIEDLLDFSTDDEALAMVDSSVAAGGQQLTPAPPASASFPPPPPPVVAPDGCRVYEDNKISDEINVGEDWITNFLDDSNFEIDFPATTNAITTTVENVDYVNKDESLFQSFSPISVLDELSSEKGGSSSSSSSFSSSASSSNNETVCLAPVGPTMMLVPARARTKRPRRPATAHVTAPIVPPASEGPPAVPTLLPPECESFTESCPVPMKKKKKKGGPAAAEDGIAVQRCLHCGIQKTPQWRAGPMGPKTLCNACGVRYKSGRLFPEYRPAASPTFVPSIHSNSHKKVVEMRNKACQKKAANGMPLPEYPAAKNCDLLAYIRG